MLWVLLAVYPRSCRHWRACQHSSVCAWFVKPCVLNLFNRPMKSPASEACACFCLCALLKSMESSWSVGCPPFPRWSRKCWESYWVHIEKHLSWILQYRAKGFGPSGDFFLPICLHVKVWALQNILPTHFFIWDKPFYLNKYCKRTWKYLVQT